MLIDNVETFGPRGVGQVGGVIHIVDTEGQRIFLPLYKIVSDGHALLQRFRLRVADIFFYVGFHLPFVGGMRFAYVNGQEVGAIFVIVINFDHVADVAPEGWSSVAAENYYQWLCAGAFAQMKMVGAVQGEQLHIWRIIAEAQLAAVHVRERVAHHPVDVFGAAGHEREAGESNHQQCEDAAERPFRESAHRYSTSFTIDPTNSARTIAPARGPLHSAYTLGRKHIGPWHCQERAHHLASFSKSFSRSCL